MSRLLIVSGFFLVFSALGTIHGIDIYVPDDYPTIQEAIEAAQDGDRVVVRPGTYVENIDFLGKAITVLGEEGRDDTTIDGSLPDDPDHGSTVIFITGEGPDSVLEGFTIENGSGSFHGDPPQGTNGGGIYCYRASPKILCNRIRYNITPDGGGGLYCFEGKPHLEENIIERNTAYGGAGICYELSSGRIIDNTINNNEALDDGGGIICSKSYPLIRDNVISYNNSWNWAAGIGCWHAAPVIIDNDIIGNWGGSGAGIYCDDSHPTIAGNRIMDNRYGPGGTDGWGGGIMCWWSSKPLISRNLIQNNSARYGGGIYCSKSSIISVRDNLIIGNSAEKGGGLQYNGGPLSEVTLYSNLFAENHADTEGGGARLSGVFQAAFNTFYKNDADLEGGALYLLNATLTMKNTILYGNTAPVGSEMYLTSLKRSHLAISYSDVDEGQAGIHVESGSSLDWGPGMIDTDPLFLDPDNHDFHLQQDPAQPGVDNPCVDAGDPSDPLPRGTTCSNNCPDENIPDLGYHYPLISEPFDFTLESDMAPLIPNSTFTLTVSGAVPRKKVYLVWGIKGPGNTYVPQLDVTLDLLQPSLVPPPKTADSTGAASWTVPVPSLHDERAVWVQAIQQGRPARCWRSRSMIGEGCARKPTSRESTG